jgi:drug/metabolite transporter (DMT)-like permease
LADAQYASVAASIFGIITILLAWIILREKMTVGQWTGVLVCFGGIAYLAL